MFNLKVEYIREEANWYGQER